MTKTKSGETTVTLFSLSLSGTNKSEERRRYRVLLDSGSSATIVTRRISLLDGNNLKTVKSTKWQTTAGNFLTASKTIVKFYLDEFSLSKKVVWKCHVSNTSLLEYDMIMGR